MLQHNSNVVSKEHQELVNTLAKALESKEGITITHVAIQGTPEYFDEKYKKLPTPPEYDKRIPDLQGDKEGVTHIGEAEIDPDDDNVEDQLKAFSSWVMKEGEIPIPLHIIVPKEKEDDIIEKIKQAGLNDKLNKKIFVWS